jgi:peptidoglycan L-alanyl-D-glutamate endopeptidase CwlK
MFKFSKQSQDKLNTCHLDLIKLMETAIKSSPIDFSIVCGYRGEKDQNKAYREGNSDLLYPHSRHNKIPSLAIDIAPYPIDWDDIDRFVELHKHVDKVAKELGISIWWGGYWNDPKDYGHYELIQW